MENVEDLLSKLLSSDEGIAGLEEFMKNMGMSENQNTNSSDNKSGKSGNNKSDNNETEDIFGDMFGGINLDAIMKIGAMFSQFNEPDKNTALLIALKPHLREENQKKIDSAVKLFRLISMLPMLKESGLFDNLF